MAPVLFATGLSAALPHVGFAHVDPVRVVHDTVHNRVGMYPAAEPQVPVLLLELGTEDGRGRAAPQLDQLHQLRQHRPELDIGRAIAFCDGPFTDLSLRTSLALILLAM